MQPDKDSPDHVTLCLTGDVMTGRGIDRILSHPCDPRIFESYMDSAVDYVKLAERASGSFSWPVDFAYVWGDVLAEIDRQAPDLRLINLETAVTTHDEPLPKGINYRMHPANLPVLDAAGVEGCVLANNHVLDWGVEGLLETLDSLEEAGIPSVGAGRDREEATTSASFSVPGGRVRLFALGLPSSGVPLEWTATDEQPGVHVLPDITPHAVDALIATITEQRDEGERLVVSLHWGGNWGYEISDEHRDLAHRLIDEAGVDIVWGHSSHHPMGIEVYRDRPILYGCGDLINDYEGIPGFETFRDDLALLYFPTLNLSDGRLQHLTLVPFQRRHLRLDNASHDDAQWLCRMLNREGRDLGSRVSLDDHDRLIVEWR
jgi:poly-gamma-glutamate synthesis protein (capsule biosynthesis protein)